MRSGLLVSFLARASFLSIAAATACGEAPEVAPTLGPSITIEVSPLSLPGVADVCYGVYVQNAAGDLVAYRSGVCSSRYGAGGGLSYVIPCDATSPASGDADNTVTLVLEGVDLEPGEATRWLAHADYVNPCGWPEITIDADALGFDGGVALPLPSDPPHDGPSESGVNWDGFVCQRTVTCEPNQDAAVVFDLTVMRRAEQGFFDIAVEFEDIFCSAKLDCEDDDAEPLKLLYDASGQRAETVVLGLACTAGPAADTHIYLTDVTITCSTGAPVTLSPSIGDGGNAYAPPHPIGEELVYQYAVYEGREQLPGLNKAFWNLAIGLDTTVLPSRGTCSLHTRATASDGPLTDGAIPDGRVYPVLNWSVVLNPGGVAAPSCGRVPLGAPGLEPGYTRPGEAAICFGHELRVDWDEPEGAVATEPVTATTGPCAGGDPEPEPLPTPIAGWRGSSGAAFAKAGEPDIESLGAPSGVSGQTMALAMDAEGDPVVAWASNGSVRAARHKAGSWTAVGGPLTDPAGSSPSARSPTVVVDGAGAVVMGWVGNNGLVYAARNLGGEWSLLGDGLMDPGASPWAQSPVLATGEAGVPVLLWKANDGTVPVVRWDGAAWEWLGAPLPDPGVNPWVRYASHAVAPDGDVFVAINSNDGHVYVAQWDGGAWSGLGGGLQEPIDNPAPYRASISVGRTGGPVVGWAGNDGRVWVTRWSGTSWEWLGSGLLESTPNPWARDAVVAVGDTPLVAWAGNDGGIHLARFRAGTWSMVDLAGPQSSGALLVAGPGQSARSWSRFE